MDLEINDFPNEILCKILSLLSTEEKFRAREVCKRWREQVDTNVLFHIQLSDSTYNEVRQRFQMRRVASLQIASLYSHSNIPIENLNSLRRLELVNDIGEEAFKDLFTRAAFLKRLKLNVLVESSWEEPNPNFPGNTYFPALSNIKHLSIEVMRCEADLATSLGACSVLIDHNMHNVQSLTIKLSTGTLVILQGLDYFRLAASKANLRKFIFTRNPSLKMKPNSDVFLKDALPISPTLSTALRKLRLTHVKADVMKIHEKAWEVLLSEQKHMKTLQLYSDSSCSQGISLSAVLPVIRKSWASLHTIALEIDINRSQSGGLDMDIFADLKSLRYLNIKSWSNKNVEFSQSTTVANTIPNVPKIYNCDAIITTTLRKLSIIGFKLTDVDFSNVMSKIGKLDMGKMEVTRNKMPSSARRNSGSWVRETGMNKGIKVGSHYYYLPFPRSWESSHAPNLESMLTLITI
ncbi:unnamed protein product [Orchesella dallaii]|uniref:F-box domain-containing protein n=1 Tax=Orchesella dallaii TaxID=48710 RepID=A0ABP1RAK7_9HEXA